MSGADAVKFQTYFTDNRAPDVSSDIRKILSSCELPLESFLDLKQHADQLGIQFFSTPFCEKSAQYLKKIGCDIFKISSFDVSNKSFLRCISELGGTVIMSSGMSNLDEIKLAREELQINDCHLALLHCVSSYPTPKHEANLQAINTLLNEFSDLVIGYSDHCVGNLIAEYAVAAGATIIEKHYMIDENMDCVDAPVSITQNQMSQLVQSIRQMENYFGNGELDLLDVERPALSFKRVS